jgi:hypothetical protein
MDSKQMQVVMLWISTGLKVVTTRLVLLVALSMVFGLFCWALYWPTWERIACVTLFAILVYLPIVRIDNNQSKNRAIVNPQESQNE